MRAFSPQVTSVEDPVTGSLNASLGQWLLATGRVTAPYVASQGTVMGRRGRVHVSREQDQVWVAAAAPARHLGVGRSAGAPARS